MRARTLPIVTLASILLGCAASAGQDAAPAPSVPVQAPVEVSLERRCMGCPREMKLVIREHRATRTRFGNARSGTVDRTFEALVPAGQFQDLVQVLRTEGFFGLSDTYSDPRIADGEWIAISARTADGEKRVVDRNKSGPENLRRIERAIDTFGEQLTWREAR